MALALTSRRRAVAAAASAMAAMALAAAVAGRNCNAGESSPESAVRAMMTAAKADDRHAVFDLLTPETQDRLTERARQATDLVGAGTRYTAYDLISIGGAGDLPAPTDITTIDEHGSYATVEIVSPAGRSRLGLVRIDGRWRVDLPGYGAP